MGDLLDSSCTAIGREVRAGNVRAADVLERYLARIEAVDGEVRSFVRVDPEPARRRAEEIDQRARRGANLGALAGVPVALETRYNAAHNKLLIADAEGPGCAVLTGSYNFSWSAQNRNAENILVVRGDCPLAQAYAANWRRHRRDATPIERLPFRP